jgi:DNA-binding protein H-NS
LSVIFAFPFAPQGAGARLRALCGSHLFDCIGIVEGNQMNLKSMSIDRLTDLRHRVEAALAGKVTDQRRELESELAKLNRFQGGKTLRKNGSGFGLRAPVPPKYRNPQNPEETWAGRGLRPKWLTAAIKGGKSADDFLIRGAVLSKKATKPKRARKARK